MKYDIWINYTILEAKEMKKEILVILYDLSGGLWYSAPSNIDWKIGNVWFL